MKKTCSILLALLLALAMLPLYACAESAVEEPFTMRCGIQFGDTMETVLEKDVLFASGEDESSDGENVLYKKEISVAGVNFDEMRHRFNENGLYATSYYGGYYFMNEKCKPSGNFDKLIHQLTEKYGEATTQFESESIKDYTWTIWQSDESAVTIECELETMYWDKPAMLRIGKDAGKLNYGIERVYWTYKYYTPEEAESLKAVNDEV